VYRFSEDHLKNQGGQFILIQQAAGGDDVCFAETNDLDFRLKFKLLHG
jgi:hypothetical protein